jgi:hypothetical protein
MKRHTKQSIKQKLGQFFTSNADTLLSGYEELVRDQDVVDPFSGNWDLLEWAERNGAKSCIGYDLVPLKSSTERDSLLNPPDYSGLVVVSNPPYLRNNKVKDALGKLPFQKWQQDDLYKCFIASLVEQKVDSGILIIPSNFLSETKVSIRELFFAEYTVLKSDYYYFKVFPDATTGILVLMFKRTNRDSRRTFPCTIHWSEDTKEDITVVVESKYGWLYGGEELATLIDFSPTLSIRQWTGKQEDGFYLSSVVLGLLDKGARPQGLSINRNDPIMMPKTAFTTTQLMFPLQLTQEQEEHLVEEFNNQLRYLRDKYRGLFLPNYMGAEQKILPRKLCFRLIEKILYSKPISNEFEWV